jgi:hypothetical protein
LHRFSFFVFVKAGQKILVRLQKGSDEDRLMKEVVVKQAFMKLETGKSLPKLAQKLACIEPIRGV